jgi:hypothetical protein
VLILPIKKQWFDMIMAGVKKDEYRKISPYYISRLIGALDYMGLNHVLNQTKDKIKVVNSLRITREEIMLSKPIILRNGYSRESPEIMCKVSLRIGQGKEEWGAVKGKEYFILRIHKIIATHRYVSITQDR